MEDNKVTLTIDEVNTLKFGVEVKGLDTSRLAARLIIESNGFNFDFPGTVSNGEVDVNIPIMTNMLTPNTYSAKLEIVVEGERLFTPMNLDIEFVQPVTVAANLGFTSSVSESTKSVSAEPVVIKAATVKKYVKPVDLLIKENIDTLSKAKNTNELLFLYSKTVLLRESFIPINIADVMPVLDTACTTHFGKMFSDVVKSKPAEPVAPQTKISKAP